MDLKSNKYCNSLTKYSRYKTRVVNIGDIPLGGNNPIRIQSMTTTNTMDTIATVEQAIRLADVGCEYVRITAPSLNEAENLKNIKNELRKRGYNIPLIADIHFTPKAAVVAARIVEKVRINPGNYSDKKKFQQIDYSGSDYQAEIDKIRKGFVPLLKVCKEYGTALRIGVNHGSLSDRIMSRYGDTPLGMVESALEFVRICEDYNYYNIVLSMKSSNPKVMIQAYRLLVNKMKTENMNYPLHLGVTEAGDGEDGRIKSAVGIGTLLEDGLGDTIRVSLTEKPEAEIPVAIMLINRYKNRMNHETIAPIPNSHHNPFIYNKRKSFQVEGIGGKSLPNVVADFGDKTNIDYSDFENIGYLFNLDKNQWQTDDLASDIIYCGKKKIPFEISDSIKIVYDNNLWKTVINKQNVFPLFTFDEYLRAQKFSSKLNFVEIDIKNVFDKKFKKISNNKTVVFVLTTNNLHGMAEQRRVFFEFSRKNIFNPVLLKRDYSEFSDSQTQLYSSTDLGGLLIDGFGDGVWIKSKTENNKTTNRLLFGILQAAKVRISKTEYISCPSCGRTLFDLVEITNKIRRETAHLKGIKIGIMGCIVNGPGEMADADYGYVGSGINKVSLYRGKEVVLKNIDSKFAVENLINLIKEDGNWIEPKLDY